MRLAILLMILFSMRGCWEQEAPVAPIRDYPPRRDGSMFANCERWRQNAVHESVRSRRTGTPQIATTAMIFEIQIPKNLQSTFTACDSFGEKSSSNRLTGLSKLNVFIGPNNSGKSRLLREVFSDSSLASCDETGNGVRDAQAKILDFLRVKTMPVSLNKLHQNLKNCHPRLWSRGIIKKDAQNIATPSGLKTLFESSLPTIKPGLFIISQIEVAIAA